MGVIEVLGTSNLNFICIGLIHQVVNDGMAEAFGFLWSVAVKRL